MTTWTFIDATDNGALYCARCGERQPITYPIKLDEYADLIDEFTEKHEGCEPKEEREGTK